MACLVCEKPATGVCSLCSIAEYCGEEHHKLDWQQHYILCPLLVEDGEEFDLEEHLEVAGIGKQKRRRRKGKLSRAKARKILHDGRVHGKPLTPKQRKYFGVQNLLIHSLGSIRVKHCKLNQPL